MERRSVHISISKNDLKGQSRQNFGFWYHVGYIFRPMLDFMYGWFNDPGYSLMAQAITSFCYGILLGPLSSGVWILTWTNIIYEIMAFAFTRNYNPFVRCTVICFSMFGWIIGRTLSQDEIMAHGTMYF
jgi:hypothetical protein